MQKTHRALISAVFASAISSCAIVANAAEPPLTTISKSFSPASIPVGAVSTVSLVITNASPDNRNPLVTDTLPAGLVLANPVAATDNCGLLMPTYAGNPGDSTFSFNGAVFAPGATCAISFRVTSATPGSYPNTANIASRTTNDATLPSEAASNTETLTVWQPPTISKSFSPLLIPVGGVSTVSLVITNSTPDNRNPLVTDTLPAGLVLANPVAATDNCGLLMPTYTGNPGDSTFIFNGAVFAPGATCTISFRVTSATAGSYPNTANIASRTTNDATLPSEAASNTHTLTVLQPPTISKAFAHSAIALNGMTTMTLTLTNPNQLPLTGVAVSDLFPMGLTPSNPGGSCTPTATIVGQNLSISGVTIGAAPNNQCTITATVTGTALGPWTNTTGAPTATGPTTLTGVPSNPDSVTVIAAPPVISKGFNPNSIPVGSTTVLTITIKNPNPVAMTGVSFTDAMPAAHLIITPAGDIQSAGCGVNAVGAAGSNNISLTNGTIAANGTCTITVTVQGIAPGVNGAPVVNMTSTVTGTVQTANLIGDKATTTLQIGASEISFLVRYASNLGIGDSVVNMTNIGNFSSLTGLPGGAQNGNICANVYAYSPDEQLVSCCTCVVTPNALNSLSVNGDLASNTLTPIRPSSMVIKLVASAPSTSGACNAATVTRAGAANFLAPGLEAWGSTLHALPSTAGSPAGAYGTAETPFSKAKISDAELTRMTQLCAFIQANGSGYGICKSCKVGGLGAATK